MLVGRLRNSFHRGGFGKNIEEKAGCIQQFKSAPGAAFGQNARDLVSNALSRNAFDIGVKIADGVECGGIDFEAEAGGEAHGAQHAKVVLAKSFKWIADRPDDAVIEVGAASNIVDYFAAFRVHEKRVDCKVAAENVVARIGFMRDRFGAAPVAICVIAAEGSHLNRSRIGGVFSGNQHDSELRPYELRPRKQGENAVGGGVRGDIEIASHAAQKNVANAAAHQQSEMAMTLQRCRDFTSPLA